MIKHDWNDCLQKGYFESKLILNEYTTEQINEYQITLNIFSQEIKWTTELTESDMPMV